MDRTECKTMTIYRPIIVKRNPAWPKYQMFCGQIIRIRSPLEPPECLENGEWREINFEDAA